MICPVPAFTGLSLAVVFVGSYFVHLPRVPLLFDPLGAGRVCLESLVQSALSSLLLSPPLIFVLPPNGGTHETYFHPLADRIDFVARLQVIARTKGSSSDPYPTITPRPVYAGRSANSDRIVPTPISYTLMPVSAHPVWWFVDCLTGAPKRTNLISAPIRASRHAGQKLLISRTPSHHGRVWPHRVY